MIGAAVDDPTETLAAKFAVTHKAVFPTTVWYGRSSHILLVRQFRQQILL
jgi:hypothetical protein